MNPSFRKQNLNLSSLTGKKHLDVRALEMLLQRWPDCQSSPEGRRFYRWIEPRAQKAAKKRVKRVIKAVDSRQAIPKRALVSDLKRTLKGECEALCKKIVRALYLDENGWGNCNTCGTRSHSLQWVHFISRKNGKCLIYTVENTSLGCGQCNGPGQGEYAKFRDWINARTPGLAEKLEAYAKANSSWSWTVAALEERKAKLLNTCKRMGLL